MQKAIHRIYLLFEEWQGNNVAALELDYRLHMLLGGRNRQELIYLMTVL